MSAPGLSIESKAILIDALKQDYENFMRSNLIFKNSKGLKAVYEVTELRGELMDFAKDPAIGREQLGPPPPKPDMTNMDEDQMEAAKVEWMMMMDQYNLQVQAVTMHVPIQDMIVIDHYMKKFNDMMHATPAIKGKRFHAFTKDPMDEQGSGVLGNFLKKQGQNSQGMR